MLNIGKLSADGADYYLARVAANVRDYYTGRGEAPGRWLGRATERLGVRGVVDAEVLRGVLDGRDPSSDAPLLSHPRQVPGFDLTFRPPKSVSLLWALSDEATSLEVRRAHDAAVAASLDYLERHAAFTRRGRGGHEQVAVEGFVAAAFRHRTSRADDPLLHTHVLVANLAYTPDDGQWRTLDARQLYLHAKTAGCLYQAHLRDELTRRLGVQWAPVRNGYADLAGVPREAIDAFSRRRADITAELDRRGHTSAKAAQVATLATRTPKRPPDESLHQRWHERAASVGLAPATVAGLVRRTTHQPPEPAEIEATAQHLVGPSGLTVKESTFTRREALQGWCDQLPAGAPVAEIEELADRLLDPASGAVIDLNGTGSPVRRLEHGTVIRLSDGRPVRADPGEVRFTTPELLATERRVVASAVSRQHAAAGIVPEDVVDEVLERRESLGDEQAVAVRRLCGSGAGVEVVVGKAGSGKTYLLDAAREAWHAAGFHVAGCALAARAALELRTGAAIPASTLDRLLADLQRPGGQLTDRSVLVVDEAAMVGTRPLARLLHAAENANAKVVLVGDHHQLPEIHTGGVFAGLVNRLPAVELTVNRRQTHPWEVEALDELRDGDLTDAVTAYQQHDRIVVADTADDVYQRLVDDWWQAAAEHGNDAVIVTARRTDADDLNQLARQRMSQVGKLAGHELAVDGRAFQAGDWIVCLKNRRRLGVLNGLRGTVTAVDPERRTLTFRHLGGDGEAVLPAAYLDAGWVDHAYAITAHKAQGLTCAATFVYATDAIHREWGYVALSRGRDTNRLYLAARPDPDPPDDPTHPGALQHDDRPAVVALTARLRRTGQQALALDHLPEELQALSAENETVAPPSSLTCALGDPPRHSHARSLWDEAAAAIEEYRTRHGIDDDQRPLGLAPSDPDARAAYQQAMRQLIAARRELCPTQSWRRPPGDLARQIA